MVPWPLHQTVATHHQVIPRRAWTWAAPCKPQPMPRLRSAAGPAADSAVAAPSSGVVSMEPDAAQRAGYTTSTVNRAKTRWMREPRGAIRFGFPQRLDSDCSDSSNTADFFPSQRTSGKSRGRRRSFIPWSTKEGSFLG